MPSYTLPELSEALGAPYRTLHSWVERDLIRPSVHRTTGKGRANLFDEWDALAVCILTDLRQAGVKFELIRQASQRIYEGRGALRQPAYLLVNGDVEIATSPDRVAMAVEKGGLTLAYHTGRALEKLESIRARQAQIRA